MVHVLKSIEKTYNFAYFLKIFLKNLQLLKKNDLINGEVCKLKATGSLCMFSKWPNIFDPIQDDLGLKIFLHVLTFYSLKILFKPAEGQGNSGRLPTVSPLPILHCNFCNVKVPVIICGSSPSQIVSCNFDISRLFKI